MAKRWRRVTLAAGAVLVAGFLHPPGGTSALCPSRVLLERPCLLCGLTRSVSLACRGKLAESWDMHVLGIPVVFAAFAVVLIGALRLLITRMPHSPRSA